MNLVIRMNDILVEIQEKFKRGIYQKLDLLTEEEKQLEIFTIKSSQEEELWKECLKYMDIPSRKEFQKFRREHSNLSEGLSYFHHHFLEGNMLFTYALNDCSLRWAIFYLKKKKIPFEVPVKAEDRFLSFLSFLSEKDSKNRYRVQTHIVEYYLFVLELSKKIERKNHTIFLTEEAYQEGQKLLK